MVMLAIKELAPAHLDLPTLEALEDRLRMLALVATPLGLRISLAAVPPVLPSERRHSQHQPDSLVLLQTNRRQQVCLELRRNLNPRICSVAQEEHLVEQPRDSEGLHRLTIPHSSVKTNLLLAHLHLPLPMPLELLQQPRQLLVLEVAFLAQIPSNQTRLILSVKPNSQPRPPTYLAALANNKMQALLLYSIRSRSLPPTFSEPTPHLLLEIPVIYLEDLQQVRHRLELQIRKTIPAYLVVRSQVQVECSARPMHRQILVEPICSMDSTRKIKISPRINHRPLLYLVA